MLDICDVSRIGLRDLSVYLLFLVQQVTLRKLFLAIYFFPAVLELSIVLND